MLMAAPGDVLPLTRPGSSRMSRSLALVGKAACVAILFWIVMSRVDVATMTAKMRELSVSSSLAVLGIFAIHAVLSAVRWRIITVGVGGNADFRTALSGSLIERFINQAVPSFVGGDGARILELVRRGENAATAAYSVLVDRLFALGGAFGLVVVCLPLSIFVVGISIKIVLVSIAVSVLIGLTVLLKPSNAFWARLSASRLMHYPSRVAITLRRFFLVPHLAMATAGLSLLIQSLLVVCFMVLSIALKIDLPLQDMVALFPLIMLASLVPVSLAGWGIREGASAVLLSTAGVSISNAVALSITFGIAYLATSCIAGLVWLTMHAVEGRSLARRR
jgi:uncharacterized protein (TIRG00374 family)